MKHQPAHSLLVGEPLVREIYRPCSKAPSVRNTMRRSILLGSLQLEEKRLPSIPTKKILPIRLPSTRLSSFLRSILYSVLGVPLTLLSTDRFPAQCRYGIKAAIQMVLQHGKFSLFMCFERGPQGQAALPPASNLQNNLPNMGIRFHVGMSLCSLFKCEGAVHHGRNFSCFNERPNLRE